MKSGVTLTGDWRKLNALVRKTQLTPKVINEFIAEEAERLAQNIREQMFDYEAEPNTEKTALRKGFNNPFVETGELTMGKGIVVSRIVESYKKHVFRIEGNPHLMTSRQDITYSELVTILEYGTLTIPPRPVFTLVLEQSKDDIARRLILKVKSHYQSM